MALLVFVVVGGESCPSLASFMLPPSSAPMLEILEVKLFSPPLVKAGGPYDAPAEAADASSCPERVGSAAGVEGKRTLPFDLSGPEPPPRARYAAKSFASLLAGRTGDGEVARNNIRLAASLSVGAARGVVCCLIELPEGGGGVWLRTRGSAMVEEDGATERGAAGFRPDVRAED